MSEKIKINDQVTVGPQPSEEEITQLSQEGFQTVMNFRTDGEDEQPLSTAAEGEKVRSAGMEYVNIPVDEESLDSEKVDRFRSQFEDLPKPLFAHCKSGKRAGAMVMIHMAVEQGMSGDQTLQKAEEMGFECKEEGLRTFVKDYVDSHSQPA